MPWVRFLRFFCGIHVQETYGDRPARHMGQVPLSVQGRAIRMRDRRAPTACMTAPMGTGARVWPPTSARSTFPCHTTAWRGAYVVGCSRAQSGVQRALLCTSGARYARPGEAYPGAELHSWYRPDADKCARASAASPGSAAACATGATYLRRQNMHEMPVLATSLDKNRTATSMINRPTCRICSPGPRGTEDARSAACGGATRPRRARALLSHRV